MKNKIDIDELIIHDKNKFYKNRHAMDKNELIKYKQTVDYLKHSPTENHLKGYNFCGPHTNLQLRLKDPSMYETKIKLAGKKIVGTKPYGKPINAFDKVCMEHDIAYDKATTMKDINKADDKMIRDIKIVKNKLKKKKNWNKLPFLSKEKRDYIILKNIIKYKRKVNSLNFSIINKRILNRDKSIENIKSINNQLVKEEKLLEQYKNKYTYNDRRITRQENKINKLQGKLQSLIESLSINKKTLNKLLKSKKKTIKKTKNKTKNKTKKKTKKKTKNSK